MRTNDHFQKIYDEYYEVCKRYSYSLVKDTSSADDLIQETMIKVYQNLPTFQKSNGNLKNWIITIMRNTFITDYRKKKRTKVVSLHGEDYLRTVEDQSSNIEDQGQDLKLAQIDRCINMLSDINKETLELFINGYQYSEISRVLNIPIGTVKSRINLARTKIRSMVTALNQQAA